MNLIRKVLHHSRVLLLEIFFPLMTHFLFQALDVIIRKQKFKNENQVWVCLSQHQNDSKMAIRTRLHFQVCFIASSINQNRTWKLWSRTKGMGKAKITTSHFEISKRSHSFKVGDSTKYTSIFSKFWLWRDTKYAMKMNWNNAFSWSTHSAKTSVSGSHWRTSWLCKWQFSLFIYLKVGPGAYYIEKSTLLDKQTTSAFKSKTERQFLSSKRQKTLSPGPGEYNLPSSVQTKQPYKKTSSFMSETKREIWKTIKPVMVCFCVSLQPTFLGKSWTWRIFISTYV